MKNKNKLKSNKGFTMTDIVIALFVLSIFGALITSLFYQIGYNTLEIRANATAVDYCVKIAEGIDQLSYDEINNDMEGTFETMYSIPSGYKIKVEVNKYNEDDVTKQDIIKIVKIKISYSLKEGNEESYFIKKLKIKESL